MTKHQTPLMQYEQLVVAGRCGQEMSEIGVQHFITYAGAVEWTLDICAQFHRACTALAEQCPASAADATVISSSCALLKSTVIILPF